MSDPIRSISQNNFILADQKEVSHDNTLTGNGTPESPLGVNGSGMWTNISSQFTFKNTVIWGDLRYIYYSQALNIVFMNIGFRCDSTGEVIAIEGPLRYFPKERIEVMVSIGSSQRFVDLNRGYNPAIMKVRSGSTGWMSINLMYVPYGLDS